MLSLQQATIVYHVWSKFTVDKW